MQNRFLFIWLFVCVSIFVQASNDKGIAGARIIGLAGANTAIRKEIWAGYNNPAAIAGIDRYTFAAGFERRFLLQELQYAHLAYAIPVQKAALIGTASTFGFDLYRETSASIGYARTFYERYHAGASFQIHNTAIGENYGSAYAYTFQVGTQVSLSEKLTLGADVYNLTRSSIGRQFKERIPTVYSLGVAYQPNKQCLIVLMIDKDVNFQPRWRGGIEYIFFKTIAARLGASTNPDMLYAGLGFTHKGFGLDFAMSYHTYLGFTPNLSLRLEINRKIKETTTLAK
ncbi:MAG: hypothetical protein NZ519_03770 [Bacteroidia bacterium]|nr:hypothetical protein [Bacteroidia bacterium]MDW8301285.1 hypothetical protein [Bacteroidia bacterium]